MPTQNLSAIFAGESVLLIDRIETPAWLSAELENESVLIAWLNSTTVPGVAFESDAVITFAHLGVGVGFSGLTSGLVIGGSARMSPDEELTGLTAGIAIGGSLRFVAGGNELSGLESGIVLGGAVHLASPVALDTRAA